MRRFYSLRSQKKKPRLKIRWGGYMFVFGGYAAIVMSGNSGLNDDCVLTRSSVSGRISSIKDEVVELPFLGYGQPNRDFFYIAEITV